MSFSLSLLWKHMPLNLFFIFLVMMTFSGYLSANSPPNILSDIPWIDSTGNEANNTAAYGGVTDIMLAFNHARREEEKQLNLAVGSIANLVLPAQEIWDGMNDDEKMLYLLNDERIARTNIVAGVKGLPFAGVESSIDLLAENYANLLHDTDKIDHNQPSGDASIDNPFKRIDQDSVIGSACHEFITYSENLAFFVSYLSSGTPSVPLPIERSLYQWVYVNSSSNWVHREMVLLQDVTLSSGAGSSLGFKNNNGAASHEGLIGVHRVGSTDYMPLPVPAGFNYYGVIVVLAFFDPVSDAEVSAQNCLYNVTLKTEDLNAFQVANRVSDASVTSTSTSTSIGSDGGGGGFGVQIIIFLALFAGVGFYRKRNNKHENMGRCGCMSCRD
ncbi:MAG TPA: hypothetical protein ENJ33_02000 [Thiothrix sp.]|nr:hypothetical protein [Thiothrix sp.]